ncbi:hypothetical protein CHS0354_000572 [Potamilus streckersoni]|uniref:Fibronectin type-III domain-containing protein n=1 Tax=Potamilus streckersoni TaxID=2493646 RepID=A0AAE0T7U9_9BIVA|nr:hypothetical protein CHS0354_000572 [Potamilus streckersoni]
MANVGSYSINREQRTENREQRTENREQRTENREQRTENREQRTENRKGARLKYLTLFLLSLTFFAGECAAPEPTKYTITFNSNGGSNVENITVTSGNKAMKPTDPTRANYSFAGLEEGSTHSYTLKACNEAGCSEASNAVLAKTNEATVTATELRSEGNVRPYYAFFSVSSDAPLNDYYLVLKLKSQEKPTAVQIKNGFHYRRNLSATPINIFAFGAIDLDKIVVDGLTALGGTYPTGNTPLTDAAKIRGMMLKPNNTYVLYGMKNNGTDADVKQLIELRTQILKTTQTSASDVKNVLLDTTILSVSRSNKPALKITLREGELFIFQTLANKSINDLLSISLFFGISETIWYSDLSTGLAYNLIPEFDVTNPKFVAVSEPLNDVQHCYFLTTPTKSVFTDGKLKENFSFQQKSKPGGTGQCVGTNNPCTFDLIQFVVE